MNIILLAEEEIVNQQVTLLDYRAKHIVKILRSKQGDRVTVGIINGKTGYGIIKEIARKQPYTVTLGVTTDSNPPPPPLIDIMIALPRPIMLKRIISQLTTLGVGRIFIVNSEKVEKSYWGSSLITDMSLQQHVLSGLEQAVDTRMINLSFHRGFKPFIEETLPTIAEKYYQMLVAHPTSKENLSNTFRSGKRYVLLAIGPEGGWSEYEIERMVKKGFTGFGLGPRILKVETAAIALHAMVSQLQACEDAES